MAENLRHPLEPLSADEVQQTVWLLKSLGKVKPTTRFVSISLKEPRKELVHAPQSGRAIPREAFVVLFDNATNTAQGAGVSLSASELVSWKSIGGAQPTMTIDEQIECEQTVLASAEFKAALKRQYGIEDARLVMVDIWSAGNYGSEEDR